MTHLEEFINDVTNDAFLVAVENDSGCISIRELDQIVFNHPYYEVASLETIQDAVERIEIILELEGRIVVSPIRNGGAQHRAA